MRMIRMNPIDGGDQNEVRVEGFVSDPLVELSPYGFVVAGLDGEWQITVLYSSGQGNLTPWAVILTSIDGGLEFERGECDTDYVHNEINAAIHRLTIKWIDPVNMGMSPTCAECGQDPCHCEEEDEEEEPEPEEEEKTEPDEGDYTTEDHVHFYQYGKLAVTVPEGQSWQSAIEAHEKAENYWPDVWFISDHGNAHLLSLRDD